MLTNTFTKAWLLHRNLLESESRPSIWQLVLELTRHLSYSRLSAQSGLRGGELDDLGQAHPVNPVFKVVVVKQSGSVRTSDCRLGDLIPPGGRLQHGPRVQGKFRERSRTTSAALLDLGQTMARDAFKYAAFISYSHADEIWAKWLHQKLERYRVPSRLVGRLTPQGPVPPRIGRCFRDQAELSAASHLGETLQQALKDSQALIVICSPRSANSHWVNEEINYYRGLGRGDHIFALIVDGEPNAKDSAQECFPRALTHADEGTPVQEPLAADVREGHEGKSDGFLKLVSGLIGVGFDELRRREQRRRTRLMFITVAASLAIAAMTSVLAIAAYHARNEATQRRQQADDLINFMLGDLHERLQAVGRLDVLDAVSSKVAGYLTQRPLTQLDDASLAERVRVLVQLTDIYYQRRDLDRHSQAGAQALAAARELIRRTPKSLDASELLASVLRAISAPMIENGKTNEAKSLVAEGLELSEALLKERPADAEAIFLRANFLGDSAYLSDLKEDYAPAVDNYLACANLIKPLAAAPGARADYVSLYAQCMGTAADRLLHVRPAGEAIAAFQSLLAEERASLAGNEDNAVRLEQMQGISAMATDTYGLLGRLDLATQTARESVELGRRLLAHDPKNVDWKHGFSIALFTQERVQEAAGDWPALLATSEELLSIYDEERRLAPTDTEVLRELLESHAYHAESLKRLGRTEDAIKETLSIVALAGPESTPRISASVTDAYLTLWDLYSDRAPNEADAARRTAQQRLEQGEQNKSRLTPHWRQQLKKMQMRYAYLARDVATGDRLYSELLAEDPGNGFLLTVSRHHYCQRPGFHCRSVKEWEPSNVGSARP